ncbi:MAG: hypothetical protein JWM16_5585, partial [Verrucomicrobiales bacterium]|nr:hypothetical protein [Verrucomicrobiales bacterium]
MKSSPFRLVFMIYQVSPFCAS